MNDAADLFENAAQIMRDRRGRGDRIHRTDFHAGREHAERQGGVAVDHDLRFAAARCRDAILEVEILLGPVVAGFQQLDVRLDDAGVLLAERERNLFAGDLQVEAKNIAEHPQREHVLAAPGIGDDRLALALHRDFDDLVAGLLKLIVGLDIGRDDFRVPTLTPHAFQQNGAVRLECAGADAAEQHLLVERDYQVGFVAAVGDAAGPQTDAIAAAAGHATGRGTDFRRNDLLGPDAIARLRSDRSEGLPAALRAFAGIADDLDDVLVHGDGRLPAQGGLRGRRRARARLNGGINGLGHLATLGGANTREVAFPQIDPEERAEAGFAGIVVAGITNSQVVLHAARGLAAGTHRFDHSRGAGNDVAAGAHARH